MKENLLLEDAWKIGIKSLSSVFTSSLLALTSKSSVIAYQLTLHTLLRSNLKLCVLLVFWVLLGCYFMYHNKRCDIFISHHRHRKCKFKGCEWQQYNHQQQQLKRLGVFDCIFPIYICRYISSINHIEQQYFANNGILHSKYYVNYFGIITMIRGVL